MLTSESLHSCTLGQVPHPDTFVLRVRYNHVLPSKLNPEGRLIETLTVHVKAVLMHSPIHVCDPLQCQQVLHNGH